MTICTQDRAALFGEIVNDEMCLNDAGRMVQEIWQSIPDRYPGWDIDVCVVMPDHFHGILFRQDTLDGKFAITRRGTPCGCPNTTRPYGASNIPAAPIPPPIHMETIP